MTEMRTDVLVIGGGIAGITASIEAAEAGCKVLLIEKSASLGGRVAQMNRYFPKLCPPACGLEMNYRRIRGNPRLEVLTLAEVRSISGTPGNYTAEIAVAPRYVTEDCTACGACAEACEVTRPDPFNYGLTTTKAISLPHLGAYPPRFAVERSACPDGCAKCAVACKYEAIDLNQRGCEMTVAASAVVAATGWEPYDPAKIPELGFRRCRNVVTNVIFERMAAPDGPAAGRFVRPSDGRPPDSVAFVQCAGSRDENHLPYCSGVCCSASLKHASYVRALYPEARISMFYIDVRTPGVLEEFFTRMTAENKIELIKGKVARIDEDPATGDVLLAAEDVLGGRKNTFRAGMAVLATGIVPRSDGLAGVFERDEFGFLIYAKTGLLHAGCLRRPADVAACVQDATGAALRALQCTVRSTPHA